MPHHIVGDMTRKKRQVVRKENINQEVTMVSQPIKFYSIAYFAVRRDDSFLSVTHGVKSALSDSHISELLREAAQSLYPDSIYYPYTITFTDITDSITSFIKSYHGGIQ
jgi:hypothetical protein